MQPKKLLRTRNVFSVLQKSSLPDITEREILLASILQITREKLIAHPEMSVSLWQQAIFFWYSRKRKKGTPIAYLTHQKDFYGRSFFVNRHVLVPRPETEMLIEEALGHARTQKEVTIFDIGTGSGCIPITLSKEGCSHVWGIDISSRALDVAKKNNERLQTSVQFIQGDLLSPVATHLRKEKSTQSLLITANLPYVPTNMWREEPSIQDEPAIALIGGVDGLQLCKRFIDQLGLLNKNQPAEIIVLMEMLVSQEASFLTYTKQKLPSVEVQTRHDSCNIVTIITLRLPKPSPSLVETPLRSKLAQEQME